MSPSPSMPKASGSRNVNACEPWPRLFCAVAAWLCTLGVVAPARAQQVSPVSELKNQCADAYESAQRLRAAGKLIAAREASAFCAQPTCPPLLSGDCQAWAAQLAESIPSLLIEARAPNGQLLTNVSVELDGSAFLWHNDGRAHALDPGQHRLVLSSPGLRSATESVLLLAGSQAKIVQVTLQTEPPKARFTIPTASYLLAGVGLLGLGGFSYFGLAGNSAKRDLEACKPACPESRRAPIERDYLLADASLGVSLVALGLSAWTLIAHSRPEPAPVPSVRLESTADSAFLSYSSRF